MKASAKNGTRRTRTAWLQSSSGCRAARSRAPTSICSSGPKRRFQVGSRSSPPGTRNSRRSLGTAGPRSSRAAFMRPGIPADRTTPTTRRSSTTPRGAGARRPCTASTTSFPSSSGCRSSPSGCSAACRASAAGPADSPGDAICPSIGRASAGSGSSSVTNRPSTPCRASTGAPARTSWSTSRTTPGSAVPPGRTSMRATSCCGRSRRGSGSRAPRTTESPSSSTRWVGRMSGRASSRRRLSPVGCARATSSPCTCASETGWGRSACSPRLGSPAWWRCRGGGEAPESAECGVRSAEWIPPGSSPTACVGDRTAPSIPHSALRTPHCGGGRVVAVRVGVDVGGTFTDLVALREDGAIEVRKVVTTPDDPAVGMFRALDALNGGRHWPPIDLLVHGTTIATNALLERTGARVALVTTRGFEDLLWLRRQDRAALYDLTRDHPPPLVVRCDVVPVAERMGPEGVVEPLTDDETRRVVAAVRDLSPEAIAVSLLFAFRHADHERIVAGALRAALPDVPVAASHEVLPAFREFERTSTTTVEAYLRPKVATYLGRLERDVRGRGIATLRVMASSGGTLPPAAAAARAARAALPAPGGCGVGG